jgi:LacI family transcriptional regulator
MATIRDVAKLAGVSTATVSHVINNTRVVLPDTRRAVVSAIKQLNYRPSLIARSLTTARTHTIGVLVSDITSSVYAQLARGIEEYLAPYHYHMLVCNTDNNPEREALYLDLLLHRRVDGLIIAPATGVDQPHLADFVRAHIPIVYMDRKPPKVYGPTVQVDNVGVGYMATEHLLKLGHRRIGIVTLGLQYSPSRERIEGYRCAHREYRVTIDENLIEANCPTTAVAVEAIRRVLMLPQPATALITTHSIAALRVLRELGLSYPEAVSLILIGDAPWLQAFKPVSIVELPMMAMCQKAVELCMEGIAASQERRRNNGYGSPAPQFEDVWMTAKLIERGSCKHIELH